MITVSVIEILPPACQSHLLLHMLPQTDLHCLVTAHCDSVLYFNFNNLKYSVYKIYIFICFVCSFVL
jgi:hypothetical protein